MEGGARMPRDYVVDHANRSLACDPRVGTLDLTIEVEGDRITARGRVETDDRRRAVAVVLEEQFPDWRIENLVVVHGLPHGPHGAEDIG